VHKLDQFEYPPGAWKQYRIPDLLAVFDVDGVPVPALIEVKASSRNVLSFKPEYLLALQAYADLVGLPLLFAWKHHTFWVLFEARHLRTARKNRNIGFKDAFRETLLGLLAGDFSFSFRAGVGLHLNIRKLKMKENGFEGRIEDCYILGPEGTKSYGEGGLWLLFTCLDQESLLKETDTHALQSFIVQADSPAEFAHRGLVTLLQTFHQPQGSIAWRQVLIKGLVPHLAFSPQQAVQNALEAGFIRHLIRIRPNTRPEFIK
jgi:Holliday junction resolvase